MMPQLGTNTSLPTAHAPTHTTEAERCALPPLMVFIRAQERTRPQTPPDTASNASRHRFKRSDLLHVARTLGLAYTSEHPEALVRQYTHLD
ncbi:hypothetical protein NUW54_g12289 [Trametes sanguinea]|uniref:Uncharacterized protein n=1 Tax=Trametes sanguinea TaxID=158606 RepID=A0ACC1N0C2_9APHY|nr:hypothetical protein NUW54_g12289 [Trametes sanguinea]